MDIRIKTREMKKKIEKDRTKAIKIKTKKYKDLKRKEIEFQKKFDCLMAQLKCHNASIETYGIELFNEMQENVYSSKMWYPMGLGYNELDSIVNNIEDNLCCTVILKPRKKRRDYAEAILVDEKKFEYVDFVPIITKSKYEMYLGRGYDGKIITAPINKKPHMLITGASGYGKSKFLLCVILNIMYNNTPDEAKFYFFQPAKMDTIFFAKSPYTLGYAENPEDILKCMDKIMIEIKKRVDIIKPYYIDGMPDDIENFNKKVPKKALPTIFVVTDEFSSIMPTSGDNKDAKKIKNIIRDCYSEIARVGRSVGVFLINSLQRGTMEQIPPLVKSQSMITVSFHQNNRKSGEVALDEDADKSLSLEERHMVLKIEGKIDYSYTDRLENDHAKKLRDNIYNTYKPKTSTVKKSSVNIPKEQPKKQHVIEVTKEDVLAWKKKRLKAMQPDTIDVNIVEDNSKNPIVKVDKNPNEIKENLEETRRKAEEFKKNQEESIKKQDNKFDFSKVGAKPIGYGIPNFKPPIDFKSK